MIKQKIVKTLTDSYTTTAADNGCRLVCNSDLSITVTLHAPANQNNFDLEIDNIGTGTVSVQGQALQQYTHAHVGCDGTKWIVIIGGGGGEFVPYVDSGTPATETFESTEPFIPREATKTSALGVVTPCDWLRTDTERYAGSWSLQSADIDNGESTECVFTITANQEGPCGFWYKLESEDSYDYLHFLIDEVEVMAPASGVVSWTRFQTTVSPGPHILKFRYAKDESVSTLRDCVFLDNIYFPGGDFVRTYVHNIRDHGGMPSFINKTGQALVVNATQDGLELTGVDSALGEELEIYVGYQSLLTGTVDATLGSTTLTGFNTMFMTELTTGSFIYVKDGNSSHNEIRIVNSRASNTSLVVDTAFSFNHTNCQLYLFCKGSDDNDGSAPDAEHSLATLGAAVNKIPANLGSHNACVYIAPGDYAYETLSMQDRHGAGWIEFTSQVDAYDLATAYYVRVSQIVIYNCQISLYLDTLYVTTALDLAGCKDFSVDASVFGSAETWFTIVYFRDSSGYLGGCSFINSHYLASSLISVDLNSKIIIGDTSGSNAQSALSVRGGSVVIREAGYALSGSGVPETTERGARILTDLSGATENRPLHPERGYCYFDTTIGKPIWYNGATWVTSDSAAPPSLTEPLHSFMFLGG